MQDDSGVGDQTVRPFLLPILGTWHPYKHACIVWWRNLYNFIGPLFLSMHPGNLFFKNESSLAKITYWSTLIRLSLPSWLPKMNALLNDATWRFKNTKHQKLFIYLSNLKTAVTYFLPLVRLGEGDLIEV